MALLTNLTGADNVATVETKLDAVIDTVNNTLGGGTAGQIQEKGSGTDFDIAWVDKVKNSTTSFTFNTGWSGTGKLTLTAMGEVELTMGLANSVGGTVAVTTIPSWARPIQQKTFITATYNGTDGSSPLLLIVVETTGVLNIYVQTTGAKPALNSIPFTAKWNINN